VVVEADDVDVAVGGPLLLNKWSMEIDLRDLIAGLTDEPV
jgi:hypothetical protein